MTGRTLVTGASGNAGREVVSALRECDTQIRLGIRRGEAVADRQDPFEVVHLDFYDPSTFPAAVDGCTSLFLLRPPAVTDMRRTLNVLIDVARIAGVRRIVFLSVTGAGGNRLVPHHAVEGHLRANERDWTILRPGFFAQNLASAYRMDILQDDRIYLPAGEGKVAFVDLRDVGKVAADALTSADHHAGETYTLTGPQAFSFDEVARILSDTLGRTIRYEPASMLGYVRHLHDSNLGMGQAFIQMVLHVGLRFGQAESVDPTLESLLGCKPRDVSQYIQDHATLWRKK